MKAILPHSRLNLTTSFSRNRVWWAIVGLTVVSLLWQVIWPNKTEVQTNSATNATSMSRKSRFSEQENHRKGKMRAEANPVATYLDRAKRGMTDREILGLIEDFEAMGSMPTSWDIDELADFVEKQNRWYCAAIEEALSLNSEQRRMLHDALAGHLRERSEAFQKAYLAPPMVLASDQKNRINSSDLIVLKNTSFLASHYISSDTLAPWKLCNLTDEQLKITYHGSPNRRMGSDENPPDMLWPQQIHVPWILNQTLIALDPETGEHLFYPPASFRDLACKPIGTVVGVMDISPLFPVTPDQKLADHRDDFVAQARMLHPSQLRMALIKYPPMANMLKAGLAGSK